MPLSAARSGNDHATFAHVGFLPGMSMDLYLDMCQSLHPELYRRLDLHRLPLDVIREVYDALDSVSIPFEGKEKGGRGDAYRSTQLAHPLMRATGISRLIQLAVGPETGLSPDLCILDALGGNGTLTRAARLLWPCESCPTILTGDVAAAMVSDALAQGLPAIRQAVQYRLLGDETVDAVIFAYGTHHIDPGDRPLVVAEAYQMLRPGGRLVLQDFEEGTPTARWYSEAVHRYTHTGHRHQHLSRSVAHQLLSGAGFERVEVQLVYDPCIYYAGNPDAARIGLLDYLVSLFALDKLVPPDGELDGRFWDGVEDLVRQYSTFRADDMPHECPVVTEFCVTRSGDRFRAELPRVALVAVGERL